MTANEDARDGDAPGDEARQNARDEDATDDATTAPAATDAVEAIVAGPDDDGIVGALEAEGVSVTRLEGVVTRPHLEEAGVLEADLYVLTDVGQATTIPIACDLNDHLRTVAYARDTIPEFVRGQIDLAIDPAVMTASIVAEELAEAH